MVSPVLIDPESLYDSVAVRMTLPIGSETLMRARRDGSLRFTRKGGRVFYFGRWLIDWLEEDTNQDRSPGCEFRIARELDPISS